MGILNVNLVEFGDCVTDFYEYMNRDKKPSNDRISLWFNRIRNYRTTEVFEAFSWMKDNLDSLPYNIPKQLKNAIYQVNKAKPEEQEQLFRNGMFGVCDDCNGTGIFKYVYFDKAGNRYEPIIFCSKCNNHKFFTKDPNSLKMSASELTGAGYKFKPYNRCLIKSTDIKPMGTSFDVKDIAIDFGENKRLNKGKKYKNRNIDPDKY